MKKMSKKLLLVIGLSLSGMYGAVAQQDPNGDGKWSLEEAVIYARENNLNVRQSKLNQRVSEIDVKQSKFERLPSLNAGGNYTFNSGSFQNPVTFGLLTQNAQTASIQANSSLPVFSGFQQVNQIKQNLLELQASELDYLSAQNEATIDVVTSYLNILFVKEQIGLAELQRELTRQQLDRTRILFEAGTLAENSVLDLESQLATDELDLISVQNQGDIARLGLIQLLNLPANQSFEIVVPEIPEPDQNPILVSPNQVYDVAVQTLPLVKATDLRILSAGKALDVARGAYYPRLSLFAGINSRYSNTTDFVIGRETVVDGFREQTFFLDKDGREPFVVFVPNASIKEISESYPIIDQFKDLVGKQVGVSLQVPIFNGLQVRSGVERAKVAQQNAQLNAEITRNNLRQTIEQAYVDARAAQRRYLAAKEQVAAAQKNFNNAQLRLNNGIINTIEYNIVANSLRSAQSSLIQAKYDYFFKEKVLDFYQGEDISF
ncbi:TolC family protein [Pontibacter toksunensis]|uniref:TolC family protein n=1 Tax=Pontibacter toksunensis TaxID=1332631 RepID=A0ABW6BRK2_9BACT